MNEIKQFFHCKQCIKDLPEGLSPQMFVRNESGFTKYGFQVWCLRHDKEVIHIDFKGQKVGYK